MASVLHRGGDPQVDLLALAPEQRVVGRVADQRVLERVAGLRPAAPVDQAGLHQLAQLALERVDRVRGDAASSLSENARPITEASWATSLAVPRRASRAVSESRSVVGSSRQSLDSPPSSIDRVSSSTNSGTPSVLATMCCWTRAASVVSPDSSWISCLGVLAAERAERDLHDPGPRPPRDVEGVGPDRHHQQQRRGRGLIDQPFEPGQRRGVEPVQVLDQQDHRLDFGHRQHERDQRFEGFLALAFGRHRRQRWRLGRVRQIEERGEQRQRFAQREGPQQGVESDRPCVSPGWLASRRRSSVTTGCSGVFWV